MRWGSKVGYGGFDTAPIKERSEGLRPISSAGTSRLKRPTVNGRTDVTQIKIGAVNLYMSPILDMSNGEIISYNISKSPNLEQVYDMLDRAFSKFDGLDGLILHSDQG